MKYRIIFQFIHIHKHLKNDKDDYLPFWKSLLSVTHNVWSVTEWDLKLGKTWQLHQQNKACIFTNTPSFRAAHVSMSVLRVICLYSYCFTEPQFWPQLWILAANFGFLYVNKYTFVFCSLYILLKMQGLGLCRIVQYREAIEKMASLYTLYTLYAAWLHFIT